MTARTISFCSARGKSVAGPVSGDSGVSPVSYRTKKCPARWPGKRKNHNDYSRTGQTAKQ